VKLRLLIADGDRERLELSRRFFVMCGHAVETAASGIECLEKLRQFDPNALLLEWELPWGGAEGVLACLRESRDLRRPGVVLAAASGAVLPQPAGPPMATIHRRPVRLAELLRSLQAAAREDAMSLAV
jgi:CheY-like chemotaxis protein